MTQPHIVILGAGPAGLGAAFKLARRGGLQVTLLEQNRHVGGNAGSFEIEGQVVRLRFNRAVKLPAKQVKSKPVPAAAGTLTIEPAVAGNWSLSMIIGVCLAIGGVAMWVALGWRAKPQAAPLLAESR